MPASDSFCLLSQDIQTKLPISTPNYMIPQLMIQISKIPRTKSGKTNRRAIRLAASRLSRSDLEALVDAGGGSGKMQPKTPNEKLMQSLWATALDLPTERVGISDNLFQLGGDSITAMKIVGLTRAAGYALVVSDIFSNPTLSGLAEGLQSLSLSSARNAAPLSLIPSEENIEALRRMAIIECQASADDIEDIYPCTALQEGLMSLTIKQQGSYVAQYQHRIEPDVNVPRLATAWDMVVAANPILRTRIIQSQSGRTFQVVLKHGPTCVIESCGLEESMKTAKETRIALGAPLLRSVIVSRESKANFVLTIHHAVYDGWSMTLLLEQLESAYAGQSLKPRLFTGFIEYLRRVDLSACNKFWCSQFTDLNCGMFPVPPVKLKRANKAATLQFVEHRLETPAVDSKFTLSTIARLAWAIVLSKHTDSRDVVFGATVAGRSAPVNDIEQMTGPTFATVPFRVHINHAESVQESLENVQARTIEMIPYEVTGLHNIKSLGADAAAACQFQNLLVIQQHQSFYQPKLMHEVQRFTENMATINTYPLTVLCNLNGDHILIQASFDPDILSKAETETLSYQLGQAIQQLVEKQSLQVSGIDMVGPETVQQLQAWNQHIPPRVDSMVHEVIDGYFKSQPQAPAVCSWDGDLSYGELDCLSSQLADVLVQWGVGPEVFVPVYLEKCRWTPIAMLAIMRAGGAFVLMDPAHPLDRLKLIHSQLDAPVLLTSTSLSSAALNIVSTVILMDSTNWQKGEDNKSTKVDLWRASDVQPRNKVYAVFTSGTTGTPKGVVIEHAACLTSMQALIGPMGMDMNTRALQVASYAFDVSISDHLATFLAGGCLCIPEGSQRENNLALAIEELQANFMHITPSLAELLKPEGVPGLRTLVLSGEPMTAGLVTTWADSVKLINAYGPAECSVDCFVNSSITKTTEHSNIGFATGSVGWVVDQNHHDKLAPIGTVGELLVEGPILSRGYLKDEQQTSAAFIQDPAWVRRLPPQPNPRRLYKTGDLVRYHPDDGSMCYVGRKDTQVKLRGQRLELGETEHHLKECFAEATRLMVDLIVPVSDDGRPTLMAFIEICSEYHDLHDENFAHELFKMPSDAFRTKVQEVVAQLRKKLPPAMVPGIFVPMVNIPLSSSGKTERKTVQQAASHLVQGEKRRYIVASKPKRAPVTEKERLVQSITGRVLKAPAEDIGMDDTFFEHGGDSISAIRFVGDARQAGWAVQVVDIFNQPTLTALARKMQRSEDGSISSPVSPFLLLPNETETVRLCSMVASACSVPISQIQDIYPATALQAGLLALSLKQRGAYQGYFPVRLPSNFDLDSLKRAWESTVKANVILRTRLVQDADGQLYQAVLDAEVEWPEVAELDEYIKLGAPLSISLGGPLAKTAIAQNSKQGEWYLVVTLHHALYDGWSIPLLIQDLQTAYLGEVLSPRPFNGFVDYICRTDDVASSEFWRSEFGDLSCGQFPPLPSASYVPSVDSFLEHTLAVGELSSDFTISTMVRLAWATVVSSYSGSDEVVFGTTVAGRSAPVPGIEDMTGPTIATVPIRVNVNPSMRTKDALRDIRTRGTQMIRFEQAGLQSIRSLGPEAALACQFQSLLVVQAMEETPESSDFSVAYEHAYDETAFSSYAINLTCETAPSSIKFRVAFDSRITEPAVMQMMMFQLSHAISRIMDNAMFVRDLKEISPQGMQSLLEWNAHLPPRVQACIHDLILSCSEETPDAVAIDGWDGRLTYRELDSLSFRLAGNLLSSAQVKPEMIVPILLEKSMNTVIALLGVMRAGCAFLLLDASQPVARLRAMCEAVEAKIIVTSAKHANLVPTLAPDVQAL
ncbi:NRPS, partial [Arthroderma sp. PD_2]